MLAQPLRRVRRSTHFFSQRRTRPENSLNLSEAAILRTPDMAGEAAAECKAGTRSPRRLPATKECGRTLAGICGVLELNATGAGCVLSAQGPWRHGPSRVASALASFLLRASQSATHPALPLLDRKSHAEERSE